MRDEGDWLLLVLASLQLIGAAWLLNRFVLYRRFLARAQTTPGVVIEASRDTADIEAPTYRTRVRYEVDGREYVICDHQRSVWKAHRQGKDLRIHYPADSPADGRLAQPAFAVLHLAGAILMALAAAFLLFLFVRMH